MIPSYKKIKAVIISLLFLFYGSINSRPLNIFYVVGHFPSRSQQFIMNQIKGLIDLGHNLYIFSFSNADMPFSDEDKDVYRLHERTVYTTFPHVMPSCDIVICGFGYHGKKIFEIKKIQGWLKNKKVVTCFRGSDLTAHLSKDRAMYNSVFKQCALFLPVCDYFKNILIDLGCDPSKIVVLHSAINCSLFSFKKRVAPGKKEMINFISVCRLVEKKGIAYAIKALAKVAKKYPKIRYTIVGDGPEYENLQRLVKKLGVQDIVTFFGWATQEQVAELLNKSHISLFPSIRGDDGNEEGIPNAIKEAMARCLPVVSTFHAGIPELVEDGVSGFLVPEKDVDSLVEKITWLLKHPKEWGSMGAAGRKKIEQEYEVKRTMEKLETLLYKLLVA